MNPITKKVILIVLCVVIALGGTLGIVFGTGIINTNQPSGGGGSTQPPITDGGGDSDNGNGDGDNGDNNQGGDGGEEGEQGDKKTIAINNFDYTYQSAGVDIVEYDGTQCKQFYLLSDGQEIPYNSGFVATAMVDKPYIIVYENFKTMGFVKFSCYIGFEKAARDNNSQAEVTFVVYVDNKAVFTSQPFTANTPQQLIEVDVRNADRITLVAMTEHTKNDAYVAWADCKLTYINNIKHLY